MVGKRGSRRTNSTSSRPGTRTEQPPPEANVGNMTMDQLGQFITKTIEETMKKNHEGPHEKEHEVQQTLDENADDHQSRIEITQSQPTEENPDIEEMWKEIKMMRQRLGSRAPTLKRESPLSFAVLEEELPPGFRQSNIGEYDGSTDPEEHLQRFENSALLHQYSDGVRCRVFLGTLVRSAQKWFNALQPNSIKSFEDFTTAFMHRFASSKRYSKSYLSLFTMKQHENETLREFIQRFNNVALDISAATPDIFISAFTQGLRGGEFFKSLVKKPPPSYEDLLARAEKYINLEDAQRYKRMEGKQGGSRVEGMDKGGRKRNMNEREEEKGRGKGHFSSHVPLLMNRGKIMEVEEEDKRQGKSHMIDDSHKSLAPSGSREVWVGNLSEFRLPFGRGRGPPWINQRAGEPRKSP